MNVKYEYLVFLVQSSGYCSKHGNLQVRLDGGQSMGFEGTACL